MAFDSDSLSRRTASPALAAAVIGAVVGIATIAGVAHLTDTSSLSTDTSITNPVAGSPEYGSRMPEPTAPTHK